MSEQEVNRLNRLTKLELIGEIMALQNRVETLRSLVGELNWKLNPDRMGGQFSDNEYNDRGWR